ncbi:hypothetical protein LJC22_05950, partial [Desulfosarcina sp. OttesenSCG-928-G10]|nr:hypothetical protein [Desulfosarcina sp. OttesenSCG-928-G10]
RRLSIVLVMINADNWDDEVAVEYFYGDKPQKDLDELLHALVQAADKGLEKKEADKALRDQDRDVEDDGKNFAPVFT